MKNERKELKNAYQEQKKRIDEVDNKYKEVLQKCNEMEKAIKQIRYQTWLYAESIVPPLHKMRGLAISELKDVSNDDIIIFHMSTGSRLNFDVAKYPCRKIVVYHNITPPEYFKNNDERFSDICVDGLKGAK